MGISENQETKKQRKGVGIPCPQIEQETKAAAQSHGEESMPRGERIQPQNGDLWEQKETWKARKKKERNKKETWEKFRHWAPTEEKTHKLGKAEHNK